jgi:hypothetical protein
LGRSVTTKLLLLLLCFDEELAIMTYTIYSERNYVMISTFLTVPQTPTECDISSEVQNAPCRNVIALQAVSKCDSYHKSRRVWLRSVLRVLCALCGELRLVVSNRGWLTASLSE